MRNLPLILLVLSLIVLGVACGGGGGGPSGGPSATAPLPPGRSVSYPHIDLPSTPAKAGVGVVILVDTSGSMASPVPDAKKAMRPKSQIAADALHRIVEQTETWKKTHADSHLQFGLYSFSGVVTDVLPIAEFDAAKAKAAIGRVPAPTGSTAIGRAMEKGFQALYQSGCSRKYLICITDGENTSGPAPDFVGKQLHDQTKGVVEMHFIAFDVSSKLFGFVNKDINGRLHNAGDGAELQSAMTMIYEKRILAEAPEPDK